MDSSLSVSFLGLFVMLAIIAGGIIVFLKFRRSSATFQRRPRNRHPVTRVLCAIAACAILAALAAGTLRTEDGASGMECPGLLTLPESPLEESRLVEEFEKGNLRIQAHLIVVEWLGNRWIPRHINGTSFAIPEDLNVERRLGFEIAGATVECEISIQQVVERGHDKPAIHIHGTRRAQVWNRGLRGSTRGGFHSRSGGLEHLTDVPNGSFESPFRLVPSMKRMIDCHLLVTPVAEDQAMVSVPFSEWSAGQVFPTGNDVRSCSHFSSDIPPGMVRFIEETGSSVFLLFIAAILLSQVFARRMVAMAGTLFAVILFASLLDRIQQGRCNAVVLDPKASLEERQFALFRLPSTFFHRGRSLDAITPLVSDEGSPPELALQARGLLHNLDDSRLGRALGYLSKQGECYLGSESSLTDFSPEELLAALRLRFPVEILSKKMEKEGGGYWMGSELKVFREGDPVRFLNVAAVVWRNGKVTLGAGFRELVPAFRNGRELYLHLSAKQEGVMNSFLYCDERNGWSRRWSQRQFIRLDDATVDPSILPVVSPTDFESWLEQDGGGNAAALRDLRRFRKGQKGDFSPLLVIPPPSAP